MPETSTSVIETTEYDTPPPPPPPSLLSSTASPPSYSSLPRPEEETVLYTRRHRGFNPPSDGIYTKSWDSLTLILHDQPPGADRPTYSRHNLVAGEIELKRPENVLDVVIKLEGKVTVASAGIGAEVVPTVSEEDILWSRAGTESSQKCPAILGFSLRLPSRFSRDDGISWTLPPSFEPDFMHTMFVRSTYSLTIVLTKTVKYLVSWENVKTYGIRIDYIPRSRTSQPLPQFDSIWVIKSSPDEWKQHVCTMERKEGSSLRPVECHFLVPAKYTHAVSDSIPFHIQLSSSLDTLNELLSPSDLRPRQAGKAKAPRGVPAIRVYIARQIIVEIHGKTSFQTLHIGSGTIRSVPPAYLDSETTAARGYPCLDWEGEVKCSEKIKTGGFDIGSLHVRDFVVLVLSPPSMGNDCTLLPLQIAHPVKFVTNAWSEGDTLHPQDHLRLGFSDDQ